ncbi:MAG: acyl-CoA thioesterase [Acidobacteria bacterium]|nr:acyl-CoA thioesterase [Acidobacteriota bacterium]
MDLSKGRVTTVHLIMPNDVNPLGSLFGGRALEWMDVASGLACMRLCGRPSVTASIERLDFHVPVLQGEVALVEAQITSVGRTSMNVRVDMYREQPGTGVRTLCTSGVFHMVALGQDGRPTAVVPVG